MINALLIIFTCQLLGEGIVHFTGLPIPTSVVGMVILLVGLMVKGSLPDSLDDTASVFVKYLGLLFIPAGAGISIYLSLIAEQWVIILAASFTSTVLTLILTAYAFKWLEKKGVE